jgi:Protein of unknown function (DUF3175)
MPRPENGGILGHLPRDARQRRTRKQCNTLSTIKSAAHWVPPERSANLGQILRHCPRQGHRFDGEPMPSGKKTSGTKKRWVAKVTTDSTHPPQGLFTKSASTIARTLASKRVSPKGVGSGMRMLTYFINRAGRRLSASRRAELQKAKTLLSKRMQGARKARSAKKAA